MVTQRVDHAVRAWFRPREVFDWPRRPDDRYDGARNQGDQSMFRLLTVLSLWLTVPLIGATATLPDISDGERLPGKFVWFDLITPNSSQAQGFYRAAFGWEFESVSTERGRYDLIRHDGDVLGGVYQPPAARPAALWISALSVQDIDEATSYATANAAEIVLPKRALPNLGERLVLRDPQGALVALLQTTHGDPADEPISAGRFFWLDLFTSDRRAAAAFYQGLAGYAIDERQFSELTRLVLASQGYARAGIAPLPDQVKRPGWLPYVLVDDIDTTLLQATTSGGELIVEPSAEILEGRLAVLSDPAGGVIGILERPADDARQAR